MPPIIVTTRDELTAAVAPVVREAQLETAAELRALAAGLAHAALAARPMLPAAAAAAYLGISERALYERLQRGEIAGAVRRGGRTYVPTAALDAYMAGEGEE